METLPQPICGQLITIHAPAAFLKETLPTWITTHMVASREVMRILDGGNNLDLYTLARQIRCRTAALNEVLNRIHIQRAFTCYQVEALLSQVKPSRNPILMPELLKTFQDENVNWRERRRLLSICLQHLTRLSRSAPVSVCVSFHTAQDETLLQLLEDAADQSWRFDEPSQTEKTPLLPGFTPPAFQG